MVGRYRPAAFSICASYRSGKDERDQEADARSGEHAARGALRRAARPRTLAHERLDARREGLIVQRELTEAGVRESFRAITPAEAEIGIVAIHGTPD